MALIDTSKLAGLKALIVDDNATNRQLLLKLLTNWKMAPVAVSSGVEALTRLLDAEKADEKFQIILLDHHMPNMDGCETAERIKSGGFMKDTSIVILSSVPKKNNSKRYKEIGIAAQLRKPIRQSHLFACINGIISGAIYLDDNNYGTAPSSTFGETVEKNKIKRHEYSSC